MNIGMKIFNKAMFDKFQGFADQGQIFKDDAFYQFRKNWKCTNGEIKPFNVSGGMIYQALNNSPVNDRFKDVDINTDNFTNQMVLNLIEEY